MAAINDDDDDGDGVEEEKDDDDNEEEEDGHLCLLRAFLQEPWMIKALHHPQDDDRSTNTRERARASPRADAFSFRVVFVSAACRCLGVALADAVARLVTRPSNTPSHPPTQTRRRLAGLGRCVTAVAVVLGSVGMDRRHHQKAAEPEGHGTGGGGNRGGNRGAVNGQSATTAVLDAVAADDGDDALRLYPPVLRKLGQDHSSSSSGSSYRAASSSSLASSLSSIRRTVDALAVFLTNGREDVPLGDPFAVGISSF